MNELGNMSNFFGISVTTSAQGYFLSQHKYAQEILAKAEMIDCKPYPSPMAVKPISSSADSSPFPQPSLYRSTVGVLQYMTITRHDLALAVNTTCQHMHQPSNGDFKAVKRLLRYLKGTLTQGLVCSPRNFTLTAYSDSDWAGNSQDHCSTTGYCVF